MNAEDWRKYACEFIGTFTLVFFAAGAVIVDAITGDLGPSGAGIISGLVISIVIYTFGQVSGAHVNPALSLAATLLGKLESRLLPGYVLAQLLGSLAAGAVLLMTLGDVGAVGANLPNRGIGVTPGVAFAIEVFLSFLLMWVICGTAFDDRADGGFAGLAIGATVGIEVMLMGPVAGAAMNPARALGPTLASGGLGDLWIYILGPVVGMVAGAAVYRLTHGVTAGPRAAAPRELEQAGSPQSKAPRLR